MPGAGCRRGEEEGALKEVADLAAEWLGEWLGKGA